MQSQKRVLLLGDANTGKTTFLQSALQNLPFNEQYVPTLGITQTTYQHQDGKAYTIVDVGCSPTFGGFKDGYCIASNAAILFYSVQDPESLKKIKFYAERVRVVCGDNIPLVMVGTKIDQFQRMVSESEAKKIQEEINAPQYCEISNMSPALNKGDSPINLISLLIS